MISGNIINIDAKIGGCIMRSNIEASKNLSPEVKVIAIPHSCRQCKKKLLIFKNPTLNQNIIVLLKLK